MKGVSGIVPSGSIAQKEVEAANVLLLFKTAAAAAVSKERNNDHNSSKIYPRRLIWHLVVRRFSYSHNYVPKRAGAF